LFDLAGVTCGHFLVPFWKFFGATFIGKAIVKVHIQVLFVVTLFNIHYLEWCVDAIEGTIPFLADKIHPFVEKEKAKLHRVGGVATQVAVSITLCVCVRACVCVRSVRIVCAELVCRTCV
jgi:hypothetical protein